MSFLELLGSQMCVGDDSAKSKQQPQKLIGGERFMEDQVATGHRQAELRMARHVVAA